MLCDYLITATQNSLVSITFVRQGHNVGRRLLGLKVEMAFIACSRPYKKWYFGGQDFLQLILFECFLNCSDLLD